MQDEISKIQSIRILPTNLQLNEVEYFMILINNYDKSIINEELYNTYLRNKTKIRKIKSKKKNKIQIKKKTNWNKKY